MSSSRAAFAVGLLAISVLDCGRATTSGPDPAATGGNVRAADGQQPPSSSASSTSASIPPLVPTSVVRVPSKLSDEGAIELSGLSYNAGLGRYIVVSDDTGRKEKKSSRHAPWLFVMSPAGELDAEPLSIAGLEQLNDAESITPGPDGTYFVCTSHSLNLKGHTPPERAMLLQVAVAGRSARLVGRVDLRGGSDSAAAFLGIAGLDPNGRLDIEGIAYRDGDLFVGLKSPLASDGAATLLRVSKVVDVMKKGRVEPTDLARYARLKLSVSAPEGQVSEGISDLLFLPDQSLLILANSPKGMPSDGGGSAWHVPKLAEGALEPKLLHRFPGLKPEGAALSPDGGSILVVFDRNQDVPTFARIELPH